MEALNIPEEDFTSSLIRYGLYVGAVFQMVCLGAIIFMPGGNRGGSIWSYLKGDPCDSNGVSLSPKASPKKPHRGRKQNKKKVR